MCRDTDGGHDATDYAACRTTDVNDLTFACKPDHHLVEPGGLDHPKTPGRRDRMEPVRPGPRWSLPPPATVCRSTSTRIGRRANMLGEHYCALTWGKCLHINRLIGQPDLTASTTLSKNMPAGFISPIVHVMGLPARSSGECGAGSPAVR